MSRQGRLSYTIAHHLFRKYAQGLSRGEPLTIHTFGSERTGHIDALPGLIRMRRGRRFIT